MELAQSNAHASSQPVTVLVVEDHDAYRGIMCASLRSFLPGYEIVEAASVAEAHTLLKTRAVTVIASDMTLPDGTAEDLLDGIPPALSSAPKVVVFSSYTAADLQPLLNRGCVDAFVPKDRGIKPLAEAIQQLVNSTP